MEIGWMLTLQRLLSEASSALKKPGIWVLIFSTLPKFTEEEKQKHNWEKHWKDSITQERIWSSVLKYSSEPNNKRLIPPSSQESTLLKDSRPLFWDFKQPMLISALLTGLNLTLQWKKLAEPLIGVSDKDFATIGEQANGAPMKSLKPTEFVTD